MEGIVVDTNRSIGERCHKTSDGMICIHLLTQSGDKEICTSVKTEKKSAWNPKAKHFLMDGNGDFQPFPKLSKGLELSN